MHWLLVYREEALGAAWRAHFEGVPEVELIRGDICAVQCDAVVSPANSFGFMDGGLDHALSERFGWELQTRLKDLIAQRPMGELLVGEAVVLATHDDDVPWLISAPTMRVPMRLRHSVNAYLAMKALLVAALAHELEPSIHRVAIPGLGTGVGGLDTDVAALQMWAAFVAVVQANEEPPVDVGAAQRRHRALNPAEINLWDTDD